MFDMTVKEACSAFALERPVLLSLVDDGDIGHWRLGGKVQGITSLDLEAALERLREREAEADPLDGR